MADTELLTAFRFEVQLRRSPASPSGGRRLAQLVLGEAVA